MVRNKSTKVVKKLSELLLPFEITFPVTVEISVNRDRWVYPARQKVFLHTYAEYETIAHSSYATYLGH